MKRTLQKIVSGVAGLLLLTGSSAMAAYIDWNTWSSGTTGVITTPSGLIDVEYNLGGTRYNNYPSYTPTGTFADGVIVDNAPTAANGILQITGGNQYVNTLTFSEAIINPVFSIWSLGQYGREATFVFNTDKIQLVVGGPSYEYNGSSIGVNGNVVSGSEGNGTIQLEGTFTELSWTNPNYEYWYGFNVGAPEPVPEPGTVLLFGTGVFGLVLWRKRRAS